MYLQYIMLNIIVNKSVFNIINYTYLNKRLERMEKAKQLFNADVPKIYYTVKMDSLILSHQSDSVLPHQYFHNKYCLF